MTVLAFARTVKLLYREEKGDRFFTESALLSALFQKNGMEKDFRFLHPERELDKGLAEKMLSEAKKLCEGMPLQYYIGTEFFDGHEFLVGEDVLIPRPETELLVRLGAEAANEEGLVFDFCCGSGCVGIALLLRKNGLTCRSFDVSTAALSLAEKNRDRFSLEKRLSVEKLDVLSEEAKRRILADKPCLVLSNPPYIPTGSLSALPENVSREPRLALDGGGDGLLFSRKFISLARATDTTFIFEIGIGQEEELSDLCKKSGLSFASFCDGGGIRRCVKVSLRPM